MNSYFDSLFRSSLGWIYQHRPPLAAPLLGFRSLLFFLVSSFVNSTTLWCTVACVSWIRGSCERRKRSVDLLDQGTNSEYRYWWMLVIMKADLMEMFDLMRMNHALIPSGTWIFVATVKGRLNFLILFARKQRLHHKALHAFDYHLQGASEEHKIFC